MNCRWMVVLLSSLVLAAPAAAQQPPASNGGSGTWDITRRGEPKRVLAFSTQEGTWMNLDVAPDGTEIVFDLLGDLWRVPITGGKAELLRGGVPFDVQPRYSPDGRRICFTSDGGGGDNIWVMNKDGSDARPVTKESFRLLNNAVWTPDGRFLVARKHFTSTRSLGAGEMWMYHESGGEGLQLTSRRTDQKDAGEPALSPCGKRLYFSEDMTPGSVFEYNKDPHAGIYAIRCLDFEDGRLSTLISGPGGAVRPQVSPDGKTLAYVRRNRFETVLAVYDFETQTSRDVWNGLSRDQQETWAIFGVYPGFAFLPDSKQVVIWAKGGLWRVALENGAAEQIPFECNVALEVAMTVRVPVMVGGDRFDVKVTRWPDVARDGAVVFAALGNTYIQETASQAPRRLTAFSGREFMPAFSPDGTRVVHVQWKDQGGGAIVVVDRASGAETRLTSGFGQFAEPSFSPDGRSVVFRELRSDGVRGAARNERAGIWIVAATGGEPAFVTDDGSRPRFSADGRRLHLHRGGGEGSRFVSVDLSGHDERSIATSKHATEYALSPDGRFIAFSELHHVYVAMVPPGGRELKLSASAKAAPVRRLSRTGGESPSFSADSKTVRWHLADRLFEADAADVLADERGNEEGTRSNVDDRDLGFETTADVPATDVVFTNATLVTMRGDEILEGAAIHVRGERIVAVGEFRPPAGAKVIDTGGMVVFPGIVDVHAHMARGSNGQIPEQSWPLLTNLAFGVTTIHDPSADTRTVFSEAELVRAGKLLGPRVYSTGTILYGAEGNFKAVVNSLDDASTHLRRQRAFGATSVKSYNQPRRDQRQQVMQAGRNLAMMVVPEGGSTFFHNLTQVIDGHTTLEHALPIAPIYRDVVTLFARSGTAYTPTLIVGYGGIWGENYWFQKEEVWRDERLLNFVPRPVIDARSMRRSMAPDEDFHHIELAKGAAQVVRAGGSVTVGAHGQVQGLGAHWEIGMLGQGGLSPQEAMRAATYSGARAIGLDVDLGSIETTKIADLIFYDKDRNPLADLANSRHVKWVMKGGRLFDAATLDQILPEAVKRPPGPKLDMLDGDALKAASHHCHGCGM